MYERAVGLCKSEGNHPEKRKDSREEPDAQRGSLCREAQEGEITDKEKMTERQSTYTIMLQVCVCVQRVCVPVLKSLSAVHIRTARCNVTWFKNIIFP